MPYPFLRCCNCKKLYDVKCKKPFDHYSAPNQKQEKKAGCFKPQSKLEMMVAWSV